jgi:hypothetical protein
MSTGPHPDADLIEYTIKAMGFSHLME